MNTAQIRKMATDKRAAKSTAELFAVLDLIDAKPVKDETDRWSSGLVSDIIEARYDLGSEMEAIYVDDLDYEGTYTDALRLAMQRKGVAA